MLRIWSGYLYSVLAKIKYGRQAITTHALKIHAGGINLQLRMKLFKYGKSLIENAKRSIVRNVNHTMVITYFEIDRMIVEDEQQGKAYAAYGSETMKRLSGHLTSRFGKGYSVDNLQLMRSFI